MVNVERLKQVRDAIAKHKDRFKYGAYIHPWKRRETYAAIKDPFCGTCGCVAGWTLALYRPDTPSGYELSPGNLAAVELGLNVEQRMFLFSGRGYGPFDEINIGTATAKDALDRIDYLIKDAESDLSTLQGATREG